LLGGELSHRVLESGALREVAEGEVCFCHDGNFGEDFHFYWDDTGSHHVDFFCGGEAQVEDSTFCVGAAVVDSDDDIFPVFQVCDADFRVEREGFVGGGHIVDFVDFPVGGFSSDPSSVVERGFARFGAFG